MMTATIDALTLPATDMFTPACVRTGSAAAGEPPDALRHLIAYYRTANAKAEVTAQYLVIGGDCSSTSSTVTGSSAYFAHHLGSIANDMVGNPVFRTMERLRAIRGWGRNWDAEGAAAPDPETIDTAIHLIGFLEHLRVRPNVVVTSFGQPMFLWETDEAEFELTVETADTLAISRLSLSDDGDVEAWGDIQFDRHRIPADLLVALGRQS